MTYRATRGLGAPATLTTANMVTFLDGVNNVGGCTPAVQANFNAMRCLGADFVQMLGACQLGVTPPGMTALEYAAACLSLGKCGLYAKPGCPEDEAPLAALMPQCLEQDQLAVLADCRAHPDFQGLDNDTKARCWAITRYPGIYGTMQGLPACGGARAPDPPPSVAPPQPPESTPTLVDDDAPPSLVSSSGAPESGMSESNMLLWGAAGAAALGLGYLIFRKKH